jgi:hypothetical protein
MQKFTPKQYLKIDIANSFGLDKKNWEERLAWFDQNEPNLLSQLSSAENPAMFYAGVKAWEDVKAGRASGYPISLDATSSGIQILSVLTGDKQAAIISNVVNAGKRQDAYQVLFEAMLSRVDGKMQFGRPDLKRAIMTAFYGSKAVPEEVFGKGKLLGAFFQTLEEETPFIWELNRAFLNMWNPNALKYSWVLPDNFHVHVKVTDHVQEDVEFMGEMVTTFRKENMPTPTGRSLGANVTHSLDGLIVRELLRRCSFNREQKDSIQALINDGQSELRDEESENDEMVIKLWELYHQSGYLSARILDYLDSGNIQMVDTDVIQDMLDSMPEKPFQVIPVHDCFRVHPNYGNDLRHQYNLQLSLIAGSNMLSFLLSQILGRPVPINKQSHFAQEILDTDYALS